MTDRMCTTQEETQGEHGPAAHEGPGRPTNLLACALDYASWGLYVFPLAPGTKVPLKGSRGLHDATRDPEQIKRWWGERPTANIGVNCGISGLVVLDADGAEGRDSIARLAEERKHLPITPTAFTPGKASDGQRRVPGSHRYYRGTLPSGKLKNYPGLELKSIGGYIMAAPSEHPDGGTYEFADGLSPSDVDFAPVPDWIVEESRTEQMEPIDWEGELVPSQRHPTLVRMAGHLLKDCRIPQNAALAMLMEVNERLCRPPKPSEEIEEIVRYVAGKESGKDCGTSEALRELASLNGNRDHKNLRAALGLLRDSLHGSDALTREAVAAEAIRILTEGGEKRAARLVDAALRFKRDEELVSGSALDWPELEPWPVPVDGCQVLDRIAGVIRRYVVLSPEQAVMIALWVVHAWTHDAFEISPILAITSPEKRCGKTTLLTVLGQLTPRPLHSANITAAAVFRALEKYRPTLLIDEADTFLKDDDDLRGMVNSGHSRRTAWVIRLVGDDHEPRRFSTWGAKAISCIGDLSGKHGTLSDRSVQVGLRRKTKWEKVCRLRSSHLGYLDEIRGQALRWSNDHVDALCDGDPVIPAELHDRAADNWRPLLSIADLVGGEWSARARGACVCLGREGSDEDSAGVMLLQDIAQVFEERKVSRISSADLVNALVSLTDRPWGEWWRGNPITQRRLARLLSQFGIRPRALRIQGKDGEVNVKGYDQSWFSDAFARYVGATESDCSLILPHAEPSQRHNSVQESIKGLLGSVTDVERVTDGRAPERLLDGTCDSVTDPTPSSEEEAQSRGVNPDDPATWYRCAECDKADPGVSEGGVCADCAALSWGQAFRTSSGSDAVTANPGAAVELPRDNPGGAV